MNFSMKLTILFAYFLFQVGAADKCYYASCGCPGSFLAGWCTANSYSSGWCSNSESNCGACSGAWCPGNNVASTTSTTQAATTTSTQAATTTSTQAATTTSTQAATTTTQGANPNCVPHEVLTCINSKSGYWPKCDPSQAKSIQGPAGYEFGHYCTAEWTNELNAMLSDPQINICNDVSKIKNLLGQITYETGYFSTVYQPRDGGAGLIHMIPQNWGVNAQDMDLLWSGNDYEAKVASMEKTFFQTAQYGWKSVAAWFKSTNRVIPGCGQNLFDASYNDQTKCILGGVVDRSETYNFVEQCWNEFGGSRRNRRLLSRH